MEKLCLKELESVTAKQASDRGDRFCLFLFFLPFVWDKELVA